MNLQQVTISATRQEQDVTTVPSTVSVQTAKNWTGRTSTTSRNWCATSRGVGGRRRPARRHQRLQHPWYRRRPDPHPGRRRRSPGQLLQRPLRQTQRNYVDPEIVKRVEILRGPASVLYGSNAIGGAVSYFTLDPDDIIKPGQGRRCTPEDRLQLGRQLAGYLRHRRRAPGFRWPAAPEPAQRPRNRIPWQQQRHRPDRTEANPKDVRTTNVLAKLGWN